MYVYTAALKGSKQLLEKEWREVMDMSLCENVNVVDSDSVNSAWW